jgi:peroxiredoxin
MTNKEAGEGLVVDPAAGASDGIPPADGKGPGSRPPRHVVTALRLCAALATALLLGYFVSRYTEPRSSRLAASVREGTGRHPAPDFALKDADGRMVHLTDYRGKVVLLDFWATWCGPCKIEIPWFEDFQRKSQDKGLVVLGVSMDDDGWQSVKPFLARMKVNYRVVLGNDQTAQLYGGVDALPTTFLIDRQGKIATVHVGLANRKDFENEIEQLLQGSSVNAAAGSGMPALFAGAR